MAITFATWDGLGIINYKTVAIKLKKDMPQVHWNIQRDK